MKQYRIWLKDGQSFVITADNAYSNGNTITFVNDRPGYHVGEDIAELNLNNIGGWVRVENIVPKEEDKCIGVQ